MQKIFDLIARAISILPRSSRIFLFKTIFNFRSKVFIGIRYLLLKSLSKYCGVRTYTGHNVVFKFLDNLSIGDNVSIHENCHINARGGLTIGDNVSIAHNSTIMTASHTYGDRSKPIKYNPIELKPITINDDVWIGAGVRILAGVTIGSRVIVAAGSVVTKNIPSNVIAGGVPAKTLKGL